MGLSMTIYRTSENTFKRLAARKINTRVANNTLAKSSVTFEKSFEGLEYVLTDGYR